MSEAKYDVDADITLESLDPPTQQGRKLRWSGEGDAGRVPALGETVRSGSGSKGVVAGYFQAYGSVGVQILLAPDGNEPVRLFGAEIDAMKASPVTLGK